MDQADESTNKASLHPALRSTLNVTSGKCNSDAHCPDLTDPQVTWSPLPCSRCVTPRTRHTSCYPTPPRVCPLSHTSTSTSTQHCETTYWLPDFLSTFLCKPKTPRLVAQYERNVLYLLVGEFRLDNLAIAIPFMAAPRLRTV